MKKKKKILIKFNLNDAETQFLDFQRISEMRRFL